MLSFATEFPVDVARTSTDFLRAIRGWLLGSPHTRFTAADLAPMDVQDESRAQNSSELAESLRFTSTGDEAAAVRYTKSDNGLEWVTTIGFSRQSASSWIGARISCESQHPAARLPLAKKPVLVRTLLSQLGGAPDGPLMVQARPVRLDNVDIDIAAQCISGAAGCRLPVVYVSATFDDGHLVDSDVMADQLAGMAHVVVEPNRQFSLRLMSEVSSQNVYGGTIGVYWPDAGGRRSFFIGRELETSTDIERAIFDEIRNALTNRRPQARCTWAAVQEAVSRRAFNVLREQGSTHVEKFIEEFDKESKAKEEELADAEKEIARLKAEVWKYQAQNPMQAGIALKTAREQDLFPGEVLSVVCTAIAEASARVLQDSRRQHILKSVAEANPPSDSGRARRDQLKDLLRDFRSMDAKTKRGLQEIGFAITEEGKHYKIVFQGDDRYTFTLPKSGSDYRGGLNAASDISRLLF